MSLVVSFAVSLVVVHSRVLQAIIPFKAVILVLRPQDTRTALPLCGHLVQSVELEESQRLEDVFARLERTSFE